MTILSPQRTLDRRCLQYKQILVLTVPSAGGSRARRVSAGSSTTALRAIGETTPRWERSLHVSDGVTGSRANHQRAPRFAAAYVLVRRSTARTRPGTAVSTLEGRHAATAQALLQQRAAVGKPPVRRGVPKAMKSTSAGATPAGPPGRCARLFRQVKPSSRPPRRVAALDAGAAANPLIGVSTIFPDRKLVSLSGRYEPVPVIRE